MLFRFLQIIYKTLSSVQAAPNVIKLMKKPFFVIARRNAEAIYKITDKTLYGLLPASYLAVRNDGLLQTQPNLTGFRNLLGWVCFAACAVAKRYAEQKRL
ncbi:MAG: hypothetical protein LBK94_07225 [Prevotellaceae bacterium]|jgi:hypothetical protein|nr:hypothetical protein [Prevotellaceae bacterium]